MSRNKENKKGFIAEFKKFIMRGNVLDMAVGVIVGGAFTSIVTSLNQDILTPILGIFGHFLPGEGNQCNRRKNEEEGRGEAGGACHEEMPLLSQRDSEGGYQMCPLYIASGRRGVSGRRGSP